MKFEALKVGELAKRTGLTVRTLHHYDEIGLLKPSLHTESGHRLYTDSAHTVQSSLRATCSSTSARRSPLQSLEVILIAVHPGPNP